MGIEPTRPKALDFESNASAYSATRTRMDYLIIQFCVALRGDYALQAIIIGTIVRIYAFMEHLNPLLHPNNE